MNFYLDLDPLNPEASPGKGFPGALRIVVGGAPRLSRPSSQQNEPLGSRSLAVLNTFNTSQLSLYLTNFKKVPQSFEKKILVKDQKYWAPILYRELKLVVIPKKSRILTMGTETSKLLCPGFKSLREDHGTVFYNPELDCEVIPTFHFAILGRDPSKKALLKNDLNRYFTGTFLEKQAYTLEAPKERMTGEVYLDIETSGLNPFRDGITQLGILLDKKSPAYIAKSPKEKTYQKLFELLKDKTLIGHNLAFDLSFLEVHSQLPWTRIKVKDTMLAASVLGEEILSLKHLTTQYTDRPGSHSGGGFEDPQYLAEDLAGTKAVGDAFFKRAEQQWISQLLYSLSPRIARMRLYGVNIDWHKAEDLARGYQHEIHLAQKKMETYADINWNSTEQVGKALLRLEVPLHQKTPTGRYSVSVGTLEEFREKHPVITDYFVLKDLLHELSFIQSYLEFRENDGRIHPKFSLVGAVTGRSSMSDPNLQQVPRLGPLKLLFNSRFQNGFFGLIDLAQAELRIAALLSNDEKLAEALLTSDVHRYIASILYDLPEEEVSSFQRKKSKGVTFGLLYGGGTSGLAERIGVPEEEVKTIVKTFFSLFPDLTRYIKDQQSLALTTGQSTTPLGRIRNLRSVIEMEGAHRAERIAINNPVQGTASDVMMIILNSVFEQVEAHGLQSGPIFGVHDSSTHDLHPEERDTYAKIVQRAFLSLSDTPLSRFPLWNTLPITGEFLLGRNWAQVESTNENYEPAFSYPCSSLETLF